MAIEHVNIPSEGCHEPKHISNATTSDAGKVITPSAVEGGSSTLRFLEVPDIKGAGNTPGLPVVTDGAGGLVVGSPVTGGPQFGGLTVTNNSTVIASTAAVDATFQTDTDYVQVDVMDVVSASPFSGITQDGDTLEVPVGGVYEIHFWANIKSSNNNDVVAFNFGLEGAVSTARPVTARVPNNTDPVAVSAHALIVLPEDSVVSMWLASKLTSDITIVNGRVSLRLVQPT